MTGFLKNKQRGLTLTELLVVMVIIGLLSTIAVPVYINRMEEARVNIAKAECREIAQAEEQCALIHGYYVPFQVLDDRPEKINGPGQTGDTILDDFRSQISVINPLIRPELQQGNQFSLDDLTQPRIRALVDSWQGPFLNPQRVYIVPGQDPKDPSFINRLDFPLDPWGQPYRFYSPIGIIGSNAYSATGVLGTLNVNFSNGLLTTTDDRNLDRYAVISYGRNSLSDNDTPTDRDDILYLFGVYGVESNFAL